MASRVTQTEEIQSLTGVILATEESRFAINGSISFDDLDGNQVITKDMAVQMFAEEVPPFIRILTPGQAAPLSLSLPANFNGKYQLSVKVHRGSGIWENYPAALVKDLLLITTDGGGNITDYTVNRVDIYGTYDDSSGTNLDLLIFTFSKA